PLRQMVDRLPVSRPLQRVQGGAPAILHRPPIIPPLAKMHGEFSRDLADATVVRLFLPFADAEMKALLSLGRHFLSLHLLMQGVAKAIAWGLGAVGPLIHADPPEKQLLSH